MKTIKNIHNKVYGCLCAFCLLCVLSVSCTDTWNEHYDVAQGGLADRPTMLENIAADKELAEFYRVVTAIGATDMLNSPQQLTVWAPKGLTRTQADSIIQVYQDGVSKNLKWEDNRAVTQFLQNHVALYARPISSLTNDTVSMLNKKYMALLGNSSTDGTLSGNPFHEALLSSNGIVYKTERMQTFFPNVREYLEQTTGMDSIVGLITSYDEYELNESASVPGGVVDGKTVYLDSVTVLSNDLLSSYGYIQREDSVYTLVAPTDELWAKEYARYKKFYQYNPKVANADSLSDLLTRQSIIRGRFFNTSTRNRYNRNPEDSLVNTSYNERQNHNPRQNVYYKPNEGILNGLQKVECSNGFVYVDDKGVIEPQTTFFGRYDLPAHYSAFYEIPKNSTTNAETMNVTGGTYYIYDSDTTYNVLKTYNFAQVTAVLTSSQTQLVYNLPSTMSGAYYNIYLVTVPDYMTNLPCWIQVGYMEKNANGNFPTTYKTYANPHPITADSDVPGASIIAAQSDRANYFAFSANKVDTVLIQSAVQFNYSSYGLDEGTVRLRIGSIGPGTEREKSYTRTLRLNEIILVPFETKEEAEAAADDLDAFNDELLEANKEN